MNSTQSQTQKTQSREEIISHNKNYCKKQPKTYYEYEQEEPTFSGCEFYEIMVPLGRGKYSEVFEGMDNRTNGKVVVKFLKPVR